METATMILSLGNDPVTLGLFVYGLVSTIKRDFEHREPPITWNPWRWRSLALLGGLVSAAALHLLTGRATVFAEGWLGTLLFGLLAGVVSIIGRDGLKTAAEWFRGDGVRVNATGAGAVNVTADQASVGPLPDMDRAPFPPAVPDPAPAPAPQVPQAQVHLEFPGRVIVERAGQ